MNNAHSYFFTKLKTVNQLFLNYKIYNSDSSDTEYVRYQNNHTPWGSGNHLPNMYVRYQDRHIMRFKQRSVASVRSPVKVNRCPLSSSTRAGSCLRSLSSSEDRLFSSSFLIIDFLLSTLCPFPAKKKIQTVILNLLIHKKKWKLSKALPILNIH